VKHDGGEVMVTASGDVLLAHSRRYLSSPLFVSRDPEFDPLYQRASPHSGEAHQQPSSATQAKISATL
jgi:hypothetical protein